MKETLDTKTISVIDLMRPLQEEHNRLMLKFELKALQELKKDDKTRSS